MILKPPLEPGPCGSSWNPVPRDVSLSGNIDVLIVGAGPTGLVLALWLTWLGVGV
jgi:threonine dehydrogenase-like Zn-dependent dehydrogenase